MSFRIPVSEVTFALKYGAGMIDALSSGLYGDLTSNDIDSVLEEAGRFASEIIAPLNAAGDRHGVFLKDGHVVMPPGWKEAYQSWAAAGWNGLAASPEWGGQGLPRALNAACLEMWQSASLAFGIGPMLTMAGINALANHGSDSLKKRYLPKLVSGEWMGTMLLTEPQAGSDVGALRARAERADDGSYRLYGQKIFITYGEHDLTNNIIHFVLARLPDSPGGTKGISLFLVPKYELNEDGTLGARNDIRAHSIEHKLGLHASPTCTMILGDDRGATGFLIGDEHAGMGCMFTMMNEARLAIGLSGVAVAERSFQLAHSYAQGRKQGRLEAAESPTVAIIEHPDVKRMLKTMRTLTAAARAICYSNAIALDRSQLEQDARTRAAAMDRSSLLTPISKAFSTEIGIEVASLGLQIHGGMGYIEESGAAQHFRDARIATIYEGTNGIQAIDLVTRKLRSDNGQAMNALIAEMREVVGQLQALEIAALGAGAKRLSEALGALERSTAWLLDKQRKNTAVLASATPYIRLAGTVVGGCMLAKEALAAIQLDDEERSADRVSTARFFSEHIIPCCSGLEITITEGADSVISAS